MGDANLPLLDFLLAEQPCIELFQLLTEGGSVVALDETRKIEYATRYAAHKVGESVLRLDKTGPIRVSKLGFCGTSHICYALFFDYANRRQPLLVHDFVQGEPLCEIEDVIDACYWCFDSGHFVFWIKRSHLPQGRMTMHAIDLDTQVIFEVSSISDSKFVNSNAPSKYLTIFDRDNGRLRTWQQEVGLDAYNFVPIEDPYGDVVWKIHSKKVFLSG